MSRLILVLFVGALVTLSIKHFQLASSPFEFGLFASVIAGLIFFHKYMLEITLCGVFILWMALYTGRDFDIVHHVVDHEWHMLTNVFLLLLGFAILAKAFENTKIPLWLPRILPDNEFGLAVLLVIVAVMSLFLDNIAAALIGGTIARTVFNNRVAISTVVGIAAASNAGGAPSPVGDTTTTMMWISGIEAGYLLKAGIGALIVVLFISVPLSYLQHKHQKIQADPPPGGVKINMGQLILVLMILGGTVTTNVLYDFPALGVWTAILIGRAIGIQIDWAEMKHMLRSACFIVCIMLLASMMPVDQLPPGGPTVDMVHGFMSSIFDNIPLTKLCIDQGGHDYGALAFSVGYGGSMTPFGSSAGVALFSMFPEAKNPIKWIRHGWLVILAFPIAYLGMLQVSSYVVTPGH